MIPESVRVVRDISGSSANAAASASTFNQGGGFGSGLSGSSANAGKRFTTMLAVSVTAN